LSLQCFIFLLFVVAIATAIALLAAHYSSSLISVKYAKALWLYFLFADSSIGLWIG
jgi:hypothetical protein